MLFLYNLLYLLGLILFFPKEFFKRPKGRRFQWLKEKMGWITPPDFSRPLPLLWIHAVSVGEILSLNPLIQELIKDYNLILTTITDTGKRVGESHYGPYPVKIYYLPFDLPFTLKNFLKVLSPKALLITETELWPNLINIVYQKIPVALINGRLSEKSFKNYKKFKFFFQKLLKRLSFIAVQEEIYKERFEKLGVNPEKIKVVGNLKFDLILSPKEYIELKKVPSPIIIAGSTHQSEEELILRAFLKVFPTGTLFLVPRHPQRLSEVEDLIKKHLKGKEKFLKFSELWTKEVHTFRAVILVDLMGILATLYRYCDLAIIGGSFLPHGGQNPLEALYWGKPVLIGPYTENFPFVKEFLEKGGLLQIKAKELERVFLEFLKDPQSFTKIGERGFLLLQEKKGATPRTLELIRKLLKETN